MRDHIIHQRFKFHFDGYQKRDGMKICKIISKELKLSGRSPYHSICSNWSVVCQFLIYWTGRNKNDSLTYKK